MKNVSPCPLVTNLPPCTYSLMCRARRLPFRHLPRRPPWWFRWQFARLLNGGLSPAESVQSVIGLSARLPAAERRAYEAFFCLCHRVGLTEEQILLLLLIPFSAGPGERTA